MGQYQGNLSLRQFEINLSTDAVNGLIIGLTNILELDNDFSENEDYFQEDTLELGFENEAQRVVHDFIKSKGGAQSVLDFISSEEPTNRMEELVTELIELRGNFILANWSYCSGYKLMVLETDPECYTIIIAYGT